MLSNRTFSKALHLKAKELTDMYISETDCTKEVCEALTTCTLIAEYAEKAQSGMSHEQFDELNLLGQEVILKLQPVQAVYDYASKLAMPYVYRNGKLIYSIGSAAK